MLVLASLPQEIQEPRIEGGRPASQAMATRDDGIVVLVIAKGVVEDGPFRDHEAQPIAPGLLQDAPSGQFVDGVCGRAVGPSVDGRHDPLVAAGAVEDTLAVALGLAA